MLCRHNILQRYNTLRIQDRFEIEDGVLTAYIAGTETDIRIPEGVHTIGKNVFKGMSWIFNISLPSTLKSIEAMAFKGCRQLKSITFPEGLLKVGEHAFHKCHGLEELIFPKSVTQVGNCAFLYCEHLKKAVLEGPTHLGKAVFSHNLSLEEVRLNKDLDDSNFSDEVFEGCIRLRRIILSGETYDVGNLIDAMSSHAGYPKLISSIAGSVYHSMQIEDGVLSKFSINLKNITLPEGISAVGKSCFFDKKGIVSITFPGSLKEIRSNAFLNCIGLEEITFQNEDVILDEKAFRGCCNLKRVHLSGKAYILSEVPSDRPVNELISRIRDQVLGDFYISGSILIRYMGSEEQVRIPGGVKVIGERCFAKNERVKTVLCPDGLSEIREQAFASCVSLQNIVLPDTVRIIEREAFAECRKLLKCNLPKETGYIGEYAFRRCIMLRPFDPYPESACIHPYAFYLAKQFEQCNIHKSKPDFIPARGSKEADRITVTGDILPSGTVFDASTDLIAPYAFTGRENIKSLRLSGVKRIGKYAFSACPDLEEVLIDAPGCVIGEKAFSVCPKLKKVTLSVSMLQKGIFSYCRELEEVHLSGISVLPSESFTGCYNLRRFEAKELTGVEARCFDECINLDSFDFSDIREIGERAFERCDSLKNIKLNKTICGYHAFADCAGLGSVEITDGTVLKSGVFIGCTQMNCVICNGQNYEFSRFSDCLNHTGNTRPARVKEIIASVWSCFDILDGKLLAGYSQDATAVTVPQDIEEIGQDVFRDHIRLRNINIPASVRSFGSHAFTGTAWLAGQRAEHDMVTVNSILLDGASCKGDVVLPVSVKKVASWCFAGNVHITGLKIPSERIAIANLAFRNCLNLKKITDHNGNEYVLNSVTDLRDKDYPDTVRTIFSECINCFKLNENYDLTESTGNITSLTFPEGIRSIGDGVYKDCHLLETITLSSCTASIGRSAFENSKWLRLVSNAGAVSFIGAQAFSGCQSLEHIDLSDELLELGSRCFEHCIDLKDIHISEKLAKIPERAFFRCKSLKKVVVPKSVEVIEAEAFAFCDGLEEIYIPNETVLGDRVFAYCDKIKVIRT